MGRLALLFIGLMLLWPHQSLAFLGFGAEREDAKSGLDLRQGYDVNTVVTVAGRVVSVPQVTEQKNVLIEVRTVEGSVYLAVGPEKFWEKGGVKVGVNDEISAKGSRAQGKDGKEYLLAQRVTNRSTGGQVEVRDAQGNPAWSSRATSRPDSSRRDGGAMRASDMLRGGGMLRGGDLMRGGGMMGGGMRR